ncbi:nitroreductase/quinone reductase family protein [Aldersonia sp. NBC_00410]|uniref:nitroreductase/quinone reductase family protein n=1 Tax=Aldersonia sp. NBC_00410 TaxID=2975954 RepID=UPI00224ED0F6|nr:nitroreductase/quinone reductase family protein [Aldersonia sp. NBC_00410]MCX5041599.1 nitroreductase/quinone reductase family protein [Aldersonia sp. NBC_00410]
MTNPDRIRPPRWLKPLNRVLLLVRRVGAMRDLPVLTVAGRRSGKPRRTPLTVVTLDGVRYVLEGFPGADWARNVRAAGGIADLSVGKTVERVRLVELDSAAATPVLRAWPVQAADGAKIMKDAGVVDAVTPDAFATLAGRCAVFRVETT